MKKLYKARCGWTVFAIDDDDIGGLDFEARDAMIHMLDDSVEGPEEIVEIKAEKDIPGEWTLSCEPYGESDGLKIADILERQKVYSSLAETLNDDFVKMGWNNDADFVEDLAKLLELYKINAEE